MSEQAEGKLSREIIEAIKAQGGYAIKIHGSDMMPAGTPDIIACVRMGAATGKPCGSGKVGSAYGAFIGLETKMPGKESTQTEVQKNQEAKWRGAGAICQVVTSVAQAMKVCGYS